EFDKEGLFSSHQAKDIWTDKQLYPEHLYPSFLSLLEEFKLIVKLESREEEDIYFIPSKLKKEKPKQEEIDMWWPVNHLDKTIGRKYKFKVNVPLGLFHAFMTETLRTCISEEQNKGETPHYWNIGIIINSSPKKAYSIYIWMNEQKKEITLLGMGESSNFSFRDQRFLQLIQIFETLLHRYSKPTD